MQCRREQSRCSASAVQLVVQVMNQFPANWIGVDGATLGGWHPVPRQLDGLGWAGTGTPDQGRLTPGLLMAGLHHSGWLAVFSAAVALRVPVIRTASRH